MSDAIVPVDPVQHKITLKFEKWCKLFLDEKSPSYGNATKSVMAVYNCKSYNTAGVIGHENLRKLKNLGLMFTENDGMSAKDWWKVLAAKALKGTYEQTRDFMERVGLSEPSTIPGSQINQQFNFGDLAESYVRSRKQRGLPVDDKATTGE